MTRSLLPAIPPGNLETYHSRRYSWITDQKIAVRRARNSHEGGHIDSAAAAPPWARSCEDEDEGCAPGG